MAKSGPESGDTLALPVPEGGSEAVPKRLRLAEGFTTIRIVCTQLSDRTGPELVIAEQSNVASRIVSWEIRSDGAWFTCANGDKYFCNYAHFPQFDGVGEGEKPAYLQKVLEEPDETGLEDDGQATAALDIGLEPPARDVEGDGERTVMLEMPLAVEEEPLQSTLLLEIPDEPELPDTGPIEVLNQPLFEIISAPRSPNRIRNAVIVAVAAALALAGATYLAVREKPNPESSQPARP